jgi:hypothetical protein
MFFRGDGWDDCVGSALHQVVVNIRHVKLNSAFFCTRERKTNKPKTRKEKQNNNFYNLGLPPKKRFFYVIS